MAEHIGHVITTHVCDGIRITEEQIPENCPACKEAREIEKKIQQEDDVFHRQNATPLQCAVCGTHIGYVYESDLNGSYFYCEQCKGS